MGKFAAGGEQPDRLATLFSLREQIGIEAIAFSSEGEILAVGTHQGSVEFWNLGTGARLSGIEILQISADRWFADEDDRVGVQSLVFMEGDTLLAVGGQDGVVRLWGIP